MNYQKQTLREQLAREYVLGTMSYLVRKRFERLLANDVVLRSLVNTLQNKFYPVYHNIPTVQPHARVWQGIQARLGFLPSAKSWGLPIAFWRNFAMLNLVLVMSVLALLLNQNAATPNLLALLGGDKQAPVLLAQASGANLVIQTLSPLELAADKSFELWLIQGKNAPQSLGLIPANGRKIIAIPKPLRVGIATDNVLAVSLEPHGGSPTHQPTGAVLFTGTWRII